MDLAINGSGFFQLTDTSGSTTYSRNGQFKVDQNGYIVNNGGSRLMGYMADGNGVIQPGAAVPLQLPTAGIEPNSTTSIDLEMNLDSGDAVIPNATPRIDFTAASTYSEATEMTVYDAKGAPVTLSYYFQKTATDTWDVFVTANGAPSTARQRRGHAATTSLNGGAPTSPSNPVAFNIGLDQCAGALPCH
jgi:flagellar hook protein FlgE